MRNLLISLAFIFSAIPMFSQLTTYTIECISCEKLAPSDCDVCDTDNRRNQYFSGLIIRPSNSKPILVRSPFEIYQKGYVIYFRDWAGVQVSLPYNRTQGFSSFQNFLTYILDCQCKAGVQLFDNGDGTYTLIDESSTVVFNPEPGITDLSDVPPFPTSGLTWFLIYDNILDTLYWDNGSLVGGDNWGAQVVEIGDGLSGTGVMGDPLENTAPDQTVTLTGEGSISITGTYPDFTIEGTDAQVLTMGTDSLEISNGNTVKIPNFYNSNGTVSANRTANFGTRDILFNGIGVGTSFEIITKDTVGTDNTSEIYLDDDALELSNYDGVGSFLTSIDMTAGKLVFITDSLYNNAQSSEQMFMNWRGVVIGDSLPANPFPSADLDVVGSVQFGQLYENTSTADSVLVGDANGYLGWYPISGLVGGGTSDGFIANDNAYLTGNRTISGSYNYSFKFDSLTDFQITTSERNGFQYNKTFFDVFNIADSSLLSGGIYCDTAGISELYVSDTLGNISKIGFELSGFTIPALYIEIDGDVANEGQILVANNEGNFEFGDILGDNDTLYIFGDTLYFVIKGVTKKTPLIFVDKTKAANGLSMSGDSVILGGTLNKNTIITGGAYNLYITSTNNTGAIYGYTTSGNIGSAGVYGQAGSNQMGVKGSSVSYNGVYGLSTSGTGVYGLSTSGYGISGSSSSNFGGSFSSNTNRSIYGNGNVAPMLVTFNTSLNTVKPVLDLYRSVGYNTAQNGVGSSIDLYIASKGTYLSGNTPLASKLVTYYTDADSAFYSSQFEISQSDSGSLQRTLAINPKGKLTLDGYATWSSFKNDTVSRIAGFEPDGDVVWIPRDSLGGSVVADGNGIYSGSGDLPNDVTVKGSDLYDMKFDSLQEFYVRSTDGTSDYSLRIGPTLTAFKQFDTLDNSTTVDFYKDRVAFEVTTATSQSFSLLRGDFLQTFLSQDDAFPLYEMQIDGEYTSFFRFLDGNLGTNLLKISFDSRSVDSSSITLFNRYDLAKTAPSNSIGDTSIMVWVGNGSNTNPTFIDKSVFGIEDGNGLISELPLNTVRIDANDNNLAIDSMDSMTLTGNLVDINSFNQALFGVNTDYSGNYSLIDLGKGGDDSYLNIQLGAVSSNDPYVNIYATTDTSSSERARIEITASSNSKYVGIGLNQEDINKYISFYGYDGSSWEYTFPTLTPSNSNGDTSIMIWAGNGFQGIPTFIDKTEFGGAGDGNGLISALPSGNVTIDANTNDLYIDSLDQLRFLTTKNQAYIEISTQQVSFLDDKKSFLYIYGDTTSNAYAGTYIGMDSENDKYFTNLMVYPEIMWIENTSSYLSLDTMKFKVLADTLEISAINILKGGLDLQSTTGSYINLWNNKYTQLESDGTVIGHFAYMYTDSSSYDLYAYDNPKETRVKGMIDSLDLHVKTNNTLTNTFTISNDEIKLFTGAYGNPSTLSIDTSGVDLITSRIDITSANIYFNTNTTLNLGENNFGIYGANNGNQFNLQFYGVNAVGNFVLDTTQIYYYVSGDDLYNYSQLGVYKDSLVITVQDTTTIGVLKFVQDNNRFVMKNLKTSTWEHRYLNIWASDTLNNGYIELFEKYKLPNATPATVSGQANIMVWTGTGSAATPTFEDHTIVYGELYINDDDPDTLAFTGGSITPQIITDCTSGDLRGFTHNGSGRLTYTGEATKYFLVTYSVSFSFAEGSTECEGWIFKGGNELPGSEFHRKIGTGGDVGNAGSNCIVQLAKNDYIDVRVAPSSHTGDDNWITTNFNVSIIPIQ